MNNPSDKVNLSLLDDLASEQESFKRETKKPNAHKVACDGANVAEEALALPVQDATLQNHTDAVEATEVESDEKTIRRLAALTPMEYDRARKDEARRLHVQLVTLDKMVAAERGEKSKGNVPEALADVEPWHEAVDGVALLEELVDVVLRFIVCTAETARAVALWIVMTWLIDSVDVAPIAMITAPEKRCGKTQLLILIKRLSRRPLAASNITPAAMFRSIQAWCPTLLIDEADAFMRENEELRGLLNCGHTRDSAFVVRTVGEDHTPQQFFVFGAKAVAGIGRLADTLVDRAIVFELRRKLPHEQVEKLRHAEAGMFDILRSKLARWADDNEQAVRYARPSAPDSLNDRAADNWEPLLQIAEVVGGTWPEMVRQAALVLSGDTAHSQSVGAELLSDIQEVFDVKRLARISSAELVLALCEDEEKPWATWNRGKPISPKQLSTQLRAYGIHSKNIRYDGHVPKGYERSDFKEAFSRYLSPIVAATSLQPCQADVWPVAEPNAQSATDAETTVQATCLEWATDGGHAAADSVHSTFVAVPKADGATSQPSADNGCSGVADESVEADPESNSTINDVAEDDL